MVVKVTGVRNTFACFHCNCPYSHNRYGYVTNTKIKFVIVVESSNTTLRDNEIRSVSILNSCCAYVSVPKIGFKDLYNFNLLMYFTDVSKASQRLC